MTSNSPLYPPDSNTGTADGVLLDVVADWYWEQDAELRFTTWRAGSMPCEPLDESALLGRTFWEQDDATDADDPVWHDRRASFAARRPFRDFVFLMKGRLGGQRYIAASGHAVHDAAGRFAGYRGIASDVTAQSQRHLRLNVEHALTRVLATSDCLATACEQVIRLVCGALDWACGAYWAHHAETDTLHCLQTWGRSAQFDGFRNATKGLGALPKDGGGLVRAAWQADEAIWFHDVSTAPRYIRAGEARKAGLQSAFAFHATASGQKLGVMEFYNSGQHAADPELRGWLSDIGAQVGQFVQLIQARQALKSSEARLRSLIEMSSDWTWEQDENFRFTYIEGSGRALEKLRAKGWTRASMVSLGTRRWDSPALNLNEDDWNRHRALVARHEPFYDFLIRRSDLPNGEQRWVSVNGTPIFDEDGTFRGYRGMNRDVSERKAAEERIEFLATHDALTGLPNRRLFSEILDRAVLNARRYKRKFALFVVNLDRFKLINESLGHEAGDALLREVARRLTDVVRDSDVVARLGGDEFVVLVQEADETAGIEQVARNLLAAIFKPVTLLDQECRISGSLGICTYPLQAPDADALMKNADAAMSLAKEEGKNQYRFHADQHKPQSLERMVLETSLRHAIERDQLFLHYQPKQDLRSGRVCGVEALLRWQHPELGVVSPTLFIPLAEETGLIISIGKWVLRTACQQNTAWLRAGFAPMSMAVNLSARQFSDPFLLEDIREALASSGMRPELLELELTESMVIQKPMQALTVLQEVKRMGISIAIDDFGTGYSSLAQLKNFPIDTLKIDRSFVTDLANNADDQAMTKAILAMGKTLGLTIVAEGVETEAQQAFLTEHNCDQVQGYYFSKPLAPETLQEFLALRIALHTAEAVTV